MSKYIIRYAARCRYDGETLIHSYDNEADLEAYLKSEEAIADEQNSYFEVEDEFPAIYEKLGGDKVSWIADCNTWHIARTIVSALSKE